MRKYVVKVTLGLLVGLYLSVSTRISPNQLHAKLILPSDQSDLHKFSAIIAATEPIRAKRDIDLQRNLNPLTYWLCKSQFSDPYSKIRLKNSRVDDICVDYEESLIKCVQCYGFDIEAFNALSDEVMRAEKALKTLVRLQARQYQVVATLPEELITSIHVSNSGPKSSYTGGEGMQDRKYRSKKLLAKDKHMILKFSKVLNEIESERMAVRLKLLNELEIKSLPKDMCNPEMLPVMSQPIRKACTKFPRTANKMIIGNGLSVVDFETLLERTRYDLFFRARINYLITRLKTNPMIFDALINAKGK